MTKAPFEVFQLDPASLCSSPLHLPLSPSPPFPFNLFPANPTHSSLIRTIAGSGAANSAEIMGCWETKAPLVRGFKMCCTATCKLAFQSEKPPPSHMELFFFIFLWNDGLGYEAQAGSVCSGNVDFPELHVRRGKNQRLGGGGCWMKREEQNNKGPGRFNTCEAGHSLWCSSFRRPEDVLGGRDPHVHASELKSSCRDSGRRPTRPVTIKAANVNRI